MPCPSKNRNTVTVGWAKRKLPDTIHISTQGYYLITVFPLLASLGAETLRQWGLLTMLPSTPLPGHALAFTQTFGFILWPIPYWGITG